MNAVAAVVDVPTEERRVREMVKRISSAGPAVRWRYSAHRNERFPLRLYASARREEDVGGHDALVIAVELFNPADDQGDRLIVSADIMDDEGVILEQSPRYEVAIPSEAALLRDPAAETSAVTEQVRSALQKLDQWLDSQAPTIQAALT